MQMVENVASLEVMLQPLCTTLDKLSVFASECPGH